MSSAERPSEVSLWIYAPLLVLLSLGLLVMYSASSVYGTRAFNNGTYFLEHQLAWLSVGFLGMVVSYHFPTNFLARRSGWLYLGIVTLLVLVLIPGIGRYVGGARRWLAMGPLGFQPSELAKVVMVIFVASLLSRRTDTPDEQRKSLVGPIFLCQIPVALILAEPDLGTAMVIEVLLMVLVFAAGLRPRTLLILALAALPVFYHLVFATPFRLRRLLGYIDPWAYRSTVGYQVTEALISIGSGGIFGVGLGEGKQKLFFLPEAHTDFIFAIMGEELGFVGVCALLLCYALLTIRGVRLAATAQTHFDRYLALGITALIAVPAVFNMAVATGLLPTKGLPLPLVSYGGSNLFFTLCALGMLLRIERQTLAGEHD